MISASLSLSLPRLGWKSTSMPRSRKICTAAGDKASEMRTLGLGMRYVSFEKMKRRPRRSGTWREEPGPGNGSERSLLPLPVLTGRGLGGGAFINEGEAQEPL